MVIAAALILITVFGGVIVYAEYTKSSRAKRVIVPNETSGLLFSSNYLSIIPESSFNKRYVYTENNLTQAVTVVTVCNYAQGNPSVVYGTGISYRLHASLVKISGATKTPATAGDVTDGRQVTLNFNNGADVILNSSNRSYNFNSILPGNISTADEFRVTFSAGFNKGDGLELELWAELLDTYNGISDLEAVFVDYVATAEAKSSWEGYINEAVTSSARPSAYDGLNYVFTGSGTGTCKLSWNPSYLVPNQLFLKQQNLTPASDPENGGWMYVNISVNSEVQDTYNLQFYRASSSVTFANWTAASNCVKLKFIAP